MKKNSGFTLVEVLGTIVILGLIFLLAFPPIINQIKKSSGEINEATQELIFSSTKTFIDKNSNEYPITNENVYCITLQTLVDSGDLINNLTDVISGKKIDLTKTVKVSIENDANIDYIIVKDGDCVEVIYKPPFPCGEDLVDARDNNTYQTAKFADKCWMTENLKYTGNGCLSKTWNDSALHDACMENGAEIHYQWGAVMNGSETPGAQGLCPAGWYIPTDEEWKVLEGTVDSTYGVGNSVWNSTGWRGSDAGIKLKGSPFNAKLAGFRNASGTLDNVGSYGYWWTSSPDGSSAWGRSMLSSNSGVRRITLSQAFGYSVRCVSEQ